MSQLSPPPALIEYPVRPSRSFVVPSGHDMPLVGDVFCYGTLGGGIRIEAVRDRTAWWLPLPLADVPDGAQPWPYGSALA